MAYEEIIAEQRDGIAVITLNRPDKLNALTPLTKEELRQALVDADADQSVRVIIITGAGNGFCAGADLATAGTTAVITGDDSKRSLLLQSVSTERVVETILNLTKPTICAMNGVAAGSGAGITLACDVLIASESAKFRVAFTRVGLVPAEGVSFLLAKRIGTNRALELAYTNDVIDAKEMDRIGLVNRVVPPEKLLDTAREMAKKMFQISPLTLALTKQSIHKGATTGNFDAQRLFDMLALKTLQQTEDQKEARASLIEKREPEYKDLYNYIDSIPSSA